MPFAAKEDPLFTRSRRWINNLPRHTSTIKWLTSHRPSNSSADDTRYLCSFVNRTNRCLSMCTYTHAYLCALITVGSFAFVPWLWKTNARERLVNDTCECNIRWTTIWTYTPKLFLISLRWTFLFEFLRIFFMANL